MTKVLAVELAEKYILVNSVAPGFINTPLSIMKDGKLEWDTDWFKDVYLKYEKLPMGRYGNPDDIAGAVYFFCSEDSKYCNWANSFSRRWCFKYFLIKNINLLNFYFINILSVNICYLFSFIIRKIF